MSRLVVVSGLACLSAVTACVGLSQPSDIANCAKNHQCTNSTGGSGGGGGFAGGSASSGGDVAGGAGGAAGSTAGAGAGITGTGGGIAGRGGSTGGSASAGSGGVSMGGTTSVGGAGSSGSHDAGIDAWPPGPETGDDPETNPPVPDAPQDVAQEAPGPDTGGGETGRDAVPDIAPDRAPDLTPDISPDIPDTGSPDTPNCIQKLQSNGYAATNDSGVQACSDCKENGISKEAACKSMIDCLQPVWPCPRVDSGSNFCWSTCLNKWGNDVLDKCVAALTSAACAAH